MHSTSQPSLSVAPHKTPPTRVVFLDKELLEGLARFVELVLLDVTPDAVAHLRRYVLRYDRKQEVLLEMENVIRWCRSVGRGRSVACNLQRSANF